MLMKKCQQKGGCMNGKLVGVLVVAAIVGTAVLTYKAVSSRSESEIFKLKNDVAVYKSQADNYSKVIKTIREAADSAVPVATVDNPK